MLTNIFQQEGGGGMRKADNMHLITKADTHCMKLAPLKPKETKARKPHFSIKRRTIKITSREKHYLYV